jgi:phage terminase small subunit
MRGLTEKQRTFVEEYLKTHNGTQAYQKAYPGCSLQTAVVNASKTLSLAKVRDALEEARKARTIRAKIDADWVLRRLARNANRAATLEPVKDREGNPTGEYVYQGAVVNKALELIGKHLGMFPTKMEHSGPGGGPIAFADLTEEERLNRLMELFEMARERISGTGAHGRRNPLALGSDEPRTSGGDAGPAGELEEADLEAAEGATRNGL